MKKLAYQMLVTLILSISLTLLAPTSLTTYANCDVDRAEAKDFVAGNFTANHALVETAVPPIRDGQWSAEVIWIGAVASQPVQNAAEMGWRRFADGSRKLYWGYFDGSGNFNYYVVGNAASSSYDFRIEHQTYDGLWHVYLNNGQVGTIAMAGPSGNGWMMAGGEVTDCAPPQHNGMGVSGFYNQSYMYDHSGYYAWNYFTSGIATSYDYKLVFLNYNALQTYGYN